MEFLRFKLNDTVELKKPHPCGSKMFRIMRVGSEMRLICQGCGRDLTLPRIKLESGIKTVIPKDQKEEAYE